MEQQGLIGKELGQSKNDYGDSAGIVYGLSPAPKFKCFNVGNEISVLSQKITFKSCDQNIARVSFKVYLDLEKCITVRNMSQLNWKRELYGVKLPHRFIGCGNCREDRKCWSGLIDPKMNCFECKLCKSSDKSLKKITQIKIYSTEINEPKRLPPVRNGYILPC